MSLEKYVWYVCVFVCVCVYSSLCVCLYCGMLQGVICKIFLREWPHILKIQSALLSSISNIPGSNDI